MKTSHLAFTFILTVLLVGSLSAQPMDQSTALITSDKQVTEQIPSTHLLYDNLCSSPIDMTGSPTETRYITAGTLVCICPSQTCNDCPQTCWCSVAVFRVGGGLVTQPVWNCETLDWAPFTKYTSFCFTVTVSGDYQFVIDVCDGESGSIQCGTCP